MDEIFADLDDERFSVRQSAAYIIKEANLDYSVEYIRKKLAKYRKSKKPQEINLEPSDLELPESYYKEVKPYKLRGQRKILVINDIHIPFHSINALRLALNYGKEQQVDTIILNGDVMDAHSLSRFEKDPRFRKFATELELTRQFLRNLRDFFPDADIIYKFGNHERRYEAYLQANAEALEDIEDFRLNKLLKLKSLGITYVAAKQYIKAGKLFILHGDEFKSWGGINIARLMRLKAFENVLVGHFHKTQEDIASTLSDNVIGAWAVGCLCGLHPNYTSVVNLWNYGFAIVTLNRDKSFEVDNKKIIRGVIR